MSLENSPGLASPRYLTRKKLAAFLRDQGYPVTENMLNKRCAPARGEGPRPVARWGNKIWLYDPADGLEWAEAELRPVTA
jgi:hypothetical protein